jgi:hypothetical protein
MNAETENACVVSDATAALLNLDVDLDGSGNDRDLAGLVSVIHQHMQSSLPFRTTVRYASEMDGSDFLDPGAAELLNLVRAAESLQAAQAHMLDAVITANMHLDGEGLPHIHIHE